ncbi:MAG: right-handed parallel beta-helix repeat-containing protein [Candidatus Thorarchaeota archaeon]
MKQEKLSLFLLMVTVLLVSAFVPLTNPMTRNELVHPTSPTSVLSYESHDYFYIVNDTDLAATAADESWEGDGSPETPFLIQGYEINPMREDIHIENTRLHFKILDCNITGALGGIFLGNVTNGVIQNCLFSENVYGIYLYNVTDIDVIGCSSVVPTLGGRGVYMDTAINCSIQSCEMQGATGTDAGIFGQYCEGIELFNNTVFEFENHGFFFGGCYDMDILNNTLYWNEGPGGGGPACGIQIVESELATIYGNNITENMDNGITILDVDNVTITENHLVDNWIHGISVIDSDYCIIQDNWIEGHGDGIIEGPRCGVIMVMSEYGQIIGNDFWFNALDSISLSYADFCYVFNNYINHSFDHGIDVYDSQNVTIEENEIYNAFGYGLIPACGISMTLSNNATIIHNILGHNSDNGITILNSQDGKVIGNTIFDSEYYGLSIAFAAGWNISRNVIYDNGGPGIAMIVPVSDNIIYYNDIGWSGEFLVYDDGDGNYWNYTTIGNWYSDHNGSSTYPITGSAGEIDYYPSMSLYCGATTPSEYEIGTTGNTMTWNSSALNPGTYELLIDSEPQGKMDWDGGPIAADVDGLSVGVYNVTLVTFHVSGHWLSNQSTLTVVDTDAPVWDITPVDQHLEYGSSLSYQITATDPSGIDDYWLTGDTGFAISSTGLITNTTFLEVGTYEISVHANDTSGNEIFEEISIFVTDTIDPIWVTTPVDQNMEYAGLFLYQINATDLSGIDEYWLTGDTGFAIDSSGLITNSALLEVGTYVITVHANDTSGNEIFEEISIIVADTFDPAWVVTPTDQVILKNETFSYQLSAFDFAGISWALDNTTYFSISGDGLITNTTILAPGIYYLEITVTDGHSNSISTTIMITVNDTVTPTPPIDPAMVALAIGGIGAGVVIILIVVVVKKKTS